MISFLWGIVVWVFRMVLGLVRILFYIALIGSAILGWGWISNVILGNMTTGQYFHKVGEDFKQSKFGLGVQEKIANQWTGPALEAIDRVMNIKGVLNGVHKTYYGDGKIKSETTYKDGKPDGPVKKYYPDGRLEAEGAYRDGVLDGIVKEYDESGQLKTQGFWKNGKFEKMVKTADVNGEAAWGPETKTNNA